MGGGCEVEERGGSQFCLDGAAADGAAAGGAELLRCDS